MNDFEYKGKSLEEELGQEELSWADILKIQTKVILLLAKECHKLADNLETLIIQRQPRT